jgi:phospholipid/cholesterol/gamma-HCH transport system substrate-binding protein
MQKSRLEIKVGLFVAVGLVLLAALLLQFSKSTSVFRGTYTLKLHTANVGGLKERAAVLLAGVPVGTVWSMQLAPDGKSVTVLLKIYKDYVIYGDARFVIEQSGFLGDPYVAVDPTANLLPPWKDGADVDCEEPFNLQEVARSASGFIKRIDATAQKLDASVTDLRNTVLNATQLTNFSVTMVNLREFSQRALDTVGDINAIITTNGTQVGDAVSNLVYFSQETTKLAQSAQAVLNTNGDQITAATKNIESSTEVLKSLLTDVQSGKGLAGTVLENEQLATNVQAIASNLSLTTSNLNRLGLWGFLWHKEKPPTNSPPPDSGNSSH